MFFIAPATDTSQRDGVLFSPSKKRRGPNAPKPISLKIAYREIASVGVKSDWSESGVALSMRDGRDLVWRILFRFERQGVDRDGVEARDGDKDGGGAIVASGGDGGDDAKT